MKTTRFLLAAALTLAAACSGDVTAPAAALRAPADAHQSTAPEEDPTTTTTTTVTTEQEDGGAMGSGVGS